MDRLGYDRYDAEFEAVTARLAAAAIACAPDDPAPACPEWTVRDVVTHVGTGHRWAADIIERRLREPVAQTPAPAPQEQAQWPDWLAEGARRLRVAVRDGGPEQPVWTWQADKTAGFWLRRMLHDELVHRFDIELAGDHIGEVAPDLAADGVTDLLECITTLTRPRYKERSNFGGLAGDGQTLKFRPADLAGSEWFVERDATGVNWRHSDEPADVTVRAPARELLLVLNRRLDPAAAKVEISGDAELFAHWLANGRF
jgi:uncharacterized protein (TIGR03083 family)